MSGGAGGAGFAGGAGGAGAREFREFGACPFGVCDGSGMVYDEESNTAYDCRCRRQIIAQRKARSLSAVIPRRYHDAASTATR